MAAIIAGVHTIGVEKNVEVNELQYLRNDLHYLRNGQSVRYKIPKRTVHWTGVMSRDGIVGENGLLYGSLSGFAKAGLEFHRPDRYKKEVSGWDKCEVLEGMEWVKADTLRNQ